MRVLLELLWLQVRVIWRFTGSPVTRVFTVLLTLSVFALMAAGLAAMTGSAVLFAQRTDSSRAIENLVLLGFTGWMVYVTLAPLVGIGSGFFVDISRLHRYPISSRTIFMAGLLGFGCSPALFLVLPALLTVTFLLSPVAIVPRLALLALFGLFLACVAQMFMLTTLLAMGRRRLTDLITFLAPMIGLGAYLLFRVGMQSGVEDRGLALLRKPLPEVLWWLPSGWAARVYLAEGGMPEMTGLSIAIVGLTAGAFYLGSWLEERVYFSEWIMPRVTRKTARGGRAKTAAEDRESMWTRMLPASFLALLWKEFLLLRREPTMKSMLLQQTGFLLAIITLSLAGSHRGEGGPSLYATLSFAYVFVVAYSCLLAMLNLYGLEGRGMQTLLLTPVKRLSVVWGKTMAYLAIFMGLAVLLQTGLSLFFQRIDYLPANIVFSVVLLLVVGGGCAPVALLTATPMTPRGRGRLARGRHQQGTILRMVLGMVGLIVVGAIATPAVVAMLLPMLLEAPLLYAVAVPTALLYGLGVLGFGTMLAGQRFGKAEPILFERFVRSQD